MSWFAPESANLTRARPAGDREDMRFVRVLCLLAIAVLMMAGDRPPWRTRRRSGVFHNKLAAARVSPEDWPGEPATPADIDPERFADALRTLCGWMPPGQHDDYAKWMLSAAGDFEVDPFLLGALVYRESRCRASKEELDGVGLSLLVPDMYAGGFRGKTYRYRVHRDGRWQERELSFPRYGFFASNLKRAEPNLYLTAGLLRAWRDQEPTVHAYFEQVPHRHYVSHWVWGDKVPSARAEDRILGDRRRLLQYYGVLPRRAPMQALGLSMHAPLDGAPRVVSSGLGSDRDDGKRSHRGVDVESEFGETVRAVADGTVIYAGIDLPGQHHNTLLSRAEINEFPRRAMGRGGRYLCIQHDTPAIEGGLRSCYMHLETVEMDRGDSVRGGQRIGTVGRTGMKRSAPHLHLEFRTNAGILDPLEHLRGHLIGKLVEWDGYRIVEAD